MREAGGRWETSGGVSASERACIVVLFTRGVMKECDCGSCAYGSGECVVVIHTPEQRQSLSR